MTTLLAQQLQHGCEQLKLTVTSEQQAQLVKYLLLLTKWNKTYNLTSVREPKDMVGKHLLDSLAILPHLQGESLLDVGTGAGLPGIPIAIMRPDIAISLLDSNSKKTRFLQQAKAELELENVTVVHARIEQAELNKFAMVTARAFATINDIIGLAGQHCDDNGMLLLMKGVYPHDELAAMDNSFSLHDVVSLAIPDTDAERHLVRLTKGEG